jgi:hypothetical protein
MVKWVLLVQSSSTKQVIARRSTVLILPLNAVFPGVNFIKLWQNANGKMCKVASRAIFLPISKKMAHALQKIFIGKSMVKLVFKNKQLICLSRRKVIHKNVDEIDPSVYFTNILRAAFTYESFLRSYYVLTSLVL